MHYSRHPLPPIVVYQRADRRTSGKKNDSKSFGKIVSSCLVLRQIPSWLSPLFGNGAYSTFVQGGSRGVLYSFAKDVNFEISDLRSSGVNPAEMSPLLLLNGGFEKWFQLHDEPGDKYGQKTSSIAHAILTIPKTGEYG